MPRIADVVLIGGMPVNGAVCSAYKASRFTSIPAINASPPTGGPDAGPVTSGQNFGGDGEFLIQVPTQEDYYIAAVSGGTTAWKFYAADVDGSVGTAGQVLASGGPGAPLIWQSVSGTGTVTSVAAADATIVIGGTPTVAPTVRVGSISEGQVTNLNTDLNAKLTNPLTTTGDTVYSSAGSTAARLGVGANGQVLTVFGGLPSWQNSTSGFSNPMTTLGDIITANTGGTAQRLGVGTTGQVMTVVGGAPAWATDLGTGTVTSVTGTAPVVITGTPATVPNVTVTLASPTIALGSAAAAGAATSLIRSDATIAAFDATAPVVQAFADGAAVGSINFAARRDHKHGMPDISAASGKIVVGGTTAARTVDVGTGIPESAITNLTADLAAKAGLGAPGFTLGTSNVQGGSANAAPLDSTIAAFDATVPTSIVSGAAAATGSVALAARRDHTHGAPVIVSSVTAASGKIVMGGSGTAPTVDVGTGIPESSITNLIADLAAKLTNPLTTTGDIIYSSSGTTAARLGIGGANQILTVVGGVPTWQNAAAGFTNPMTTLGDIITATTGGAAQRLAVGSNNQVLTVVSGAPAWAAASGGGVATVTAGDGTITIGGSGTNPTVAVNAIAESQVTGLVADLAGKAGRISAASSNIVVAGGLQNPNYTIDLAASPSVTSLTAASGVTITAGGLSVLGGNITVPNGGTVTSSGGAITLKSGAVTSNVTLQNGSNNTLQLIGVNTAVNSLTLTNAATTNRVALSTVGTDASVGLNLVLKGTGDLAINGAPGTTGQVLTSNGTGASPTWTTLSGSGTVTSVTGTAPVVITGTPTTVPNVTVTTAAPTIALGTAAAAGSATSLILSDATIAAFDTTAPVTQASADVAATGSINFAARRDHKHGMPTLTSGTVTSVAGTSPIVITGTPTTTPTVTLSSVLGTTGTSQTVYGQPNGTGQLLNPAIGTAGTPDTTIQPGIKITRLMQITQANLDTATGSAGADGGEVLAAFTAIGAGNASNEVQPVGLYGGAKNASTGVTLHPDALGVYAVGRIVSTATNGTGIGLFAIGRTDSTSMGVNARAHGAEIDVSNSSGSDHVVNPSGLSSTVGIWMNNAGANLASVGIELGNAISGGNQFDVGFHLNGQNPAKTASWQDDGNAATGLLVKGSHATAALAITSGAGAAIVGGTTNQIANTLFEVQGTDAVTDPLVYFGNSAFTRTYSTRIRNAVSQGVWGVVGVANQLLTGAAAGDVVLLNTGGTKAIRFGVAATPVMTLSSTLDTHSVPANIPNVDPIVHVYYR